ncbi:hypothetical protein Tco_1527969, partial [Tanacetum coccineum]
VADALAEIETNKTSRNGDDSHDYGTGSRRTERAARECTYGDFLKCQPLNFKDTEGVVGLTQWFEKIESVFHIRNPEKDDNRQELALMYDRMFPKESDMIEKWTKRSVPWLNVWLRTRGNLRTLPGTPITNSSLSKGIMWHGLTLLGLVIRNLTDDPNLYALSATITMTNSVLPNAPTAKGLAI